MMIIHVDDYFAQGCGRCERFATAACSSRLWSDGLAQLRRICRDERLVETAKWGHPCYMHAGRNVAILGAFRDDFRISFFHAALLSDPDHLLTRQGPNTSHPDTIRFTHAAQVIEREPALRACLREAMAHAQAGRLPPKPSGDVELPPELAEALSADSALADAFGALTPGRQRSYVIAVNAAKKPETRVARIVGFRYRILAGKGANER